MEINMTDLSQIMNIIKKINSYCQEIDGLRVAINEHLVSETAEVQQSVTQLINSMAQKFNAFKVRHFGSIHKQIDALVDLLCQDYSSEYNAIKSKQFTFSDRFDENERVLNERIGHLNGLIQQLNNVNFDTLVPPVKIEIEGESFITYTNENRANAKHFNCDSSKMSSINDPKPIKALAHEVFLCCIQIKQCVDALCGIYEKQFNITGYNSFVKSSARSWLDELKARLEAQYGRKFDELFIDEKAQAIPRSFFTQLEAEERAADVDFISGASKYNDSINIGNMMLLVESDQEHLDYIADSPTLSNYLKDGFLSAPLILNLKECGNILLNINEDSYSESTISFVNQLIMQFLVSFPANRITFCLIDIDNKMGFSQFKLMTKINTNILFNGIIRDDRQLENTIKDMEQTMYKVDDDILSYNSVEDIFEYNEKYEANPQNVHLFVLVNYPTGMRDDIAKRVIKIIQNGNKAGIFSIIINNAACQLAPGYKQTEHQQFIENASKSSITIDKKNEQFTLRLGIKNHFEPKPETEVSINSLGAVVDMLKESAEDNRQKVVPLTDMFKDADEAVKSRKGIAPSEAVLDIPIGKRGGETQNLLLKTTGDGSAHAVLIGGTGSGKSNLLHTIIMSACYKYSPEELNLYLVDFKGGVEFEFYEANKVRANQIPHIKLIGVTSDLEDGVSILYNLQKELRRREDEFRQCGVEDVVAYSKTIGKKKPRLFVIIDEIQELFEQDDRLGQKAIDILRELFKKGRAFGINILWASQNIPKAPGLKDKVLSQIGNRISLRLNEPDDALDIKIDPKVVKNLNRPEKGLGVINDIRYGNDSVEFRVAFAETSENRPVEVKKILDKWKDVSTSMTQEPLFIVGDDDEPSPMDGNTIFNYVPQDEDAVSKSFDSYYVQLGQDYVTGKPYDMPIALRENKTNILLAGYDIEILRDMMGYALLSIITNQMTNLDCVKEGTKIYYANGEMINPKNSNDLYNVIRNDFNHMIEPVSSTEQIVNCIKTVYKTYKQRSIESDSSEYANVYTPIFVVIHSLQRYTDLFTENPMLHVSEENEQTVAKQEIASGQPDKSKLAEALDLFGSANSSRATATATTQKSKMPDVIYFSDAFKELLNRGGKFGIHFIISIDNPFAIQALKNEIPEIMYKVFVKGINSNVISQMLGDYKASNSINNPKVALVAMQDEKTKIRVYRYDDEQDQSWYKKLCANYSKLKG